MTVIKICPVCKTDYGGGEVFCPNDGTRLQTPSQMASPDADRVDPWVGQTLDGRYRILRRIGEGGMGIVYEAVHAVIEKRVALKILRNDFSSRPDVVQRFRQEAKSASRIGSEHIVDISDFGETPDGSSYFVMELLDGSDLATVLQRETTLPLSRAADILLQCCKALGAAHSKGIVHRDMKPENIFLTTRDGRSDFVKIVDFGIAKMSDIETRGASGKKLTKTGMIFGTPEYMSPEQAMGKELDHRVDIYALGVIFFEMLTGRVPFVGDSFMGILAQHMFEPPPRLTAVNPGLQVGPSIERFVERALAKDPAHRFSSCAEMAAALEDAIRGEVAHGGTFVGHGEPVTSRVTSAPPAVESTRPTEELPTLPVRRGRMPVVLGVVAVLGLLGAGAVAWRATSKGATAHGGSTVTRVGTEGPVAQGLGDTGLDRVQVDADLGAGAAVADAVGDRDAGATGLETPSTPGEVEVRVVTQPAGARVWVDGRGDVCAETPCAFRTPPGAAITVRARRGRAEGEIVITPAGPTEIAIPLVARAGGGGSHSKTGGGGGDLGHGDLKIPDVFRRRP